MHERVSFIGAGRVGSSLARLLSEKGYCVEALVSSTMEHASEAACFVGSGFPEVDAISATRSRIIFITTPDDRIAQVCKHVAKQGGWRAEHIVAHCSGALSTDVLAPARECGAAVLSLHPMQSVASPETGVKLLQGAYYGLEGCERGMAVGRQIVTALDGKPLMIAAGAKTLYHAGAVMASNYLVALMALAADMLHEAGIPSDQGVTALAGLAEGALHNIQSLGIPAALTGPIERGDVNTVKRHLEALREDKVMTQAYAVLGVKTLELAIRKHEPEKPGLSKIASLLTTAHHNTR